MTNEMRKTLYWTGIVTAGLVLVVLALALANGFNTAPIQ